MMPRLLLFFSLMILINNQSSAKDKDDWKDLFNGQDLRGWVQLNGKADYRVKDGSIVGISKFNTPNSFLCTDRLYDDFILELEVKVDPDLNSGIQFRSNSKPDYMEGRVHGYQAEIDPSDRAYSGGIYDEGRRGWIYPLSLNAKGQKAFDKNGWNKYRIEAIGNEISIFVNGVNTSNIIDQLSPTGFIGLQVHSINDKKLIGKSIEWRDIRIVTKNLEEYRTKKDNEVQEVNLVPNTLSEREKAEGWSFLWDGKSTNGWRGAKLDNFPESGWEMKDGILTVLKSDGGESTGGGDIITEKKYGEFELSLEFKITEGANSGIKYFVDPELNKGPGSAIGLEYQILDDKNHPDAKKGVKDNRTLASVYDLIAATNLSEPNRKKEFRGVGKWNLARIVVKGNHIEHWLNGFKHIDFERNTQIYRALVAYSKYAKWPKFGEAEKGHILLQDHGDTVHFRSIKIREF